MRQIIKRVVFIFVVMLLALSFSGAEASTNPKQVKSAIADFELVAIHSVTDDNEVIEFEEPIPYYRLKE